MREEVEKMIMERRPIFCKECGGRLYYSNEGVYECYDCGSTELDDFGKIKKYIEKNGPSPAIWISKDTGIDVEIINVYLKNGRLEIPEGSKFYIKCERCGCALRYGRYCLGCTKELAGQLQGAFYEQMGEKPKSLDEKNEGKMYYYEKNKKKK